MASVEIWVLADDGANASLRTTREGIVVRGLGSAPYPNDYEQGDFNPERIQLDDRIVFGATPEVNVGDSFTSAAVGVLDYEFGNFDILLTSALTRVDGGLVREVRSRAEAERADCRDVQRREPRPVGHGDESRGSPRSSSTTCARRT